MKLSKVHLYWHNIGIILVIVWLAGLMLVIVCYSLASGWTKWKKRYSAVMMCKILIRHVSDPAPSIPSIPSIVLVYDLNLNSVWVRSDVHPVSPALRRRRSG